MSRKGYSRSRSRAKSDSVEELCDNWTFKNTLPEPLVEEPTPWCVSSVSGTLYEDYRTPIQHARETQHKLLPLWKTGMKDAFEEVRVQEEKKHQKRARILAKFRNKRLKNALREQRIGYEFKREPIIFTPNADTPFNPNYGEMEDHTTAPAIMERLAIPKFRVETQTPGSAPSGMYDLEEINNLKHMRRFYHWKNQVNQARSRPESGYLSTSRTFSGYSSARPFSAVSKDGMCLDDEFKESFANVETKQDMLNRKHAQSELVYSEHPSLNNEEAEMTLSELASFEERLREI